MINLRNYSEKELLELAYSSRDEKMIKELANVESTFVRRAVARNSSVPEKIINKLAIDPVQNVSYMALKHRNCTLFRDMSDELHICVVCEKDERTMDCSMCNL